MMYMDITINPDVFGGYNIVTSSVCGNHAIYGEPQTTADNEKEIDNDSSEFLCTTRRG